MSSNKINNAEIFFGLLIGALALLAIKSIFEDDNSKIVSKKGRNILSDENKMKEINKQILSSENDNKQEIFI